MPQASRSAVVTGWVGLALILSGVSVARADEEWKFDVLYLQNGRALKGMLVSKKSNEIHFTCVNRKPGSHTVVFPTTLKPAEVADYDLLTDADREILAGRLKALDPTGKGEAKRMADLILKPIQWGKNGKGLRFESTHFVLESSAPEDVVRRAAVRLEEIYAAYARFLPPYVETAQPTTILFTTSAADFQALLKDQGRNLLNPAFYDVARNQIVCGIDLQGLGEQLETVRKEHEALVKEIAEGEAKLAEIFPRSMYPKGIPPMYLAPFKQARAKIDLQSQANDEQFEKATRVVFSALYHEAFHAYLANFVYPPDENEMPRWLNEGLAQIFESAFVEAGELRVGHADRNRLVAANLELRMHTLTPLGDLLKSGPKQFVVTHALDKQTSDRHYLTSWGVAFYLTFERRLLGTKAMDTYVRSLKRGQDPVAAFEKLTGQSVKDFEKDFHQYLSVLQLDGTVPRK